MLFGERVIQIVQSHGKIKENWSATISILEDGIEKNHHSKGNTEQAATHIPVIRNDFQQKIELNDEPDSDT